MKNMELSKPPKVEEVAETKLNMDSFDLEGKELNLEDTILLLPVRRELRFRRKKSQKQKKYRKKVQKLMLMIKK